MLEHSPKIIAVAGKGGVGKTSISAAFVRLLTEAYPDKRILAIDADPAVGLSTALGVEVKETLDALRGMGLKLAIGSSSKNTKFILSRLGLGDYFDAISDGTNITRSKPDPQVFLMAADFIGMKPEKCLVVEDAKAGIQAAIAGGFDSAGLGEAAACGMATYAMKTFGDLKAICS